MAHDASWYPQIRYYLAHVLAFERVVEKKTLTTYIISTTYIMRGIDSSARRCYLIFDQEAPMRYPSRSSHYPSSILIFLLCLNLVPTHQAEAQQRQGHRITSNRITVSSPAHWERWTRPIHAVDILPSGSVQPHFSRSRYNILEDLETYARPLPELRRKKNQTAISNIDSTETLDIFGNVILDRKDNPIYSYLTRIGISRVGSNPAAATHILDGDPNTFWEPDPNDPIDNWWIEVDLGRSVAVDELVFNFVEEEVGDPFRQFRLLTAPFQKLIDQEVDEVPFHVEGGTKGSNENQRRFSFQLEQYKADPNWVGQTVQVIRVVVTASEFGRGRLISEEEWSALDPEDRGDIVYFIRNQQGFEEPVEKSVYDDLPPERQGSIEHYIRERPRLADVEVWGYGDNLGPGIINGGGMAGFYGKNDSFSPGPSFDGDGGTNFIHLVWSPVVDRGILFVDMGATFWLDAFRVSSSLPRLLIDGYIIRGSDGARDSSGRLKWRRVSDPVREHNMVDRFEHLMDLYSDPPKVRFMEIKIVSDDPNRRGGYTAGPNVSEYQLFSNGYPAEVELVSDLIELPGARNFGGITWEEETPPGTAVDVRTRTGDLLAKEIRYFDKSGNEITADAWAGLIGSYKGPADTTFIPTQGWSSWSRPYPNPGDQVTSPGLRDYMQIQVKMTTTDRDAAASIRSIGIEMVTPVAERIWAELWPIDIPTPGIVDTFEVFIQSNFIESPFGSRSSGFDEVLLTIPASQSMELLDVGLYTDLQTSQEEQVFLPAGEGIFVDASGEQIRLLSPPAGTDSIWVQLPNTLNIISDLPKIYNRITVEGEQVPVTRDGFPLSGASYGLLDEREKGDILYFDTLGNPIGQAAHLALEEEERGPMRFFRRLTGDGAQFPFDDMGDSLDAAAYNRLSSSVKGRVTGQGPLVRLRYQAPVFLNGTTLRAAVRNSSDGINAPWQDIEPGDATALVESNSLSINVPLNAAPLDKFAIDPNPFTPNGDGINDETAIRFSVFKIITSRQAEVRIFTLDGRVVWESEQQLDSGNALIRWSGEDGNGNKVPPGLYLCQLRLKVDDQNSEATQTRLLSVVY